MGGRPWVDSQGLGITDVGQVRDDLEAINDLATGRTAALDTEAQHTAESALQVLQCVLVRRMALKARIRDPRDMRVLLQPSGKSQSVLAVALGAQTQSLDTLDELPCGKWVQAGAHISEDIDTHSDGEGDWSKGIPELQAVESWRWLNHLWEALAVLAPVEVSGVDDDTSNGSSVAANPLGGGVNDDVCAVLNWAHEVASRAEGVVHHQWDTGIMGDLGQTLKIRDVVLWVSDALDVDSLGILVNCGGEIGWVLSLDELGGDAESWEQDLQLVVCASVEVRGGDDVVSSMCERGNGHELSSLSGCCCDCCDTALEGCDSLLEDIDSWLG